MARAGAQERLAETSGQARRCPHCGAGAAPGDVGCSACGLALLEAGEAGEQPAVEGPAGAFLWSKVGATALALACRPRWAFRTFRWQGGMLAPLAFAVLVGGPPLALGQAIETWIERGRLAGEMHPLRFLALIAIGPPAYLYLRAHLIHLALVLRRAERRPFVASFRAVAYANSSVAFAWLFPWAGGFLFLFWGAIAEVHALAAAHGLSLRQALLAVLVPTGVLAAALLSGLAVHLALGGIEVSGPVLSWRHAG
jgi:hypothetical protein